MATTVTTMRSAAIEVQIAILSLVPVHQYTEETWMLHVKVKKTEQIRFVWKGFQGQTLLCKAASAQATVFGT